MGGVDDRLGKLCAAAGFGAEGARAVDLFDGIVVPVLGAPAAWESDVADDRSPLELSVALAGPRVEVRALFEPQGREPTVAAQRAAALAFVERIASLPGVDLTRLRRLADVMLPEDVRGPFALWFSIVFVPDEAPHLKAYFNAQARGPAAALEVVEEALGLLELPRAWAALRARAFRPDARLDELKYLALDLSRSASARVKIYVRHHHASADELESLSFVSHARRGEARAFVVETCGDRPLVARAAATCHAFTADTDEPAATTVYVPVCAYARDDAVARDRLRAFMIAHDVDPSPYDRLLAAFANRPLDAGTGMQSWFALRRDAGRPRLTVYLATEARRVFIPGSVPAPSHVPGGAR